MEYRSDQFWPRQLETLESGIDVPLLSHDYMRGKLPTRTNAQPTNVDRLRKRRSLKKLRKLGSQMHRREFLTVLRKASRGAGHDFQGLKGVTYGGVGELQDQKTG